MTDTSEFVLRQIFGSFANERLIMDVASETREHPVLGIIETGSWTPSAASEGLLADMQRTARENSFTLRFLWDEASPCDIGDANRVNVTISRKDGLFFIKDDFFLG